MRTSVKQCSPVSTVTIHVCAVDRRSCGRNARDIGVDGADFAFHRGGDKPSGEVAARHHRSAFVHQASKRGGVLLSSISSSSVSSRRHRNRMGNARLQACGLSSGAAAVRHRTLLYAGVGWRRVALGDMCAVWLLASSHVRTRRYTYSATLL